MINQREMVQITEHCLRAKPRLPSGLSTCSGIDTNRWTGSSASSRILPADAVRTGIPNFAACLRSRARFAYTARGSQPVSANRATSKRGMTPSQASSSTALLWTPAPSERHRKTGPES
jgi:hypothetical protein